MKSVVSYPNRGKGGRSSYRGNCSPRLIEDLHNHYGFSSISDYSCGSDTVGDVARAKGFRANTYDLNKGFDLIDDTIPEIQNEALFYHPAYFDIIKYSGHQYGDKPHKNDISHIADYKEFIDALNYSVMKQFSTLKQGGRMFILMGDIKKKGKLYSMLCDIVKPDTIENIVIKQQHNTWSNRQTYNGKFIPIEHEYLLILKRNNPYIGNLKITKDYDFDIRDSKVLTWREVVVSVFMDKKKDLTLEQLYSVISGHKKAKNNANWEAKIRQVLQDARYFTRVARGQYKLVA